MIAMPVCCTICCEPAILADPERPLKWVSKSHAKLATALRAMGHKVSPQTAYAFTRALLYTDQSSLPYLKEAVEARKQRAGHACGGDYTLSLLQ